MAGNPYEIARSGPDRFEDERCVIKDLLGSVDAVTEIATRAGAIRGNHVHQHTTQWAYVVRGRLWAAWLEDDGVHKKLHEPGDLICERAGIPHAWQAQDDCVVLVFTRGPRSGAAYETDTERLDEKYWLLR